MKKEAQEVTVIIEGMVAMEVMEILMLFWLGLLLEKLWEEMAVMEETGVAMAVISAETEVIGVVMIE